MRIFGLVLVAVMIFWIIMVEFRLSSIIFIQDMETNTVNTIVKTMSPLVEDYKARVDEKVKNQ